MGKAAGLDIGSTSVKLVVAEGSAKSFRVSRFVSREIGVVGGLGETVAAVLKQGRALRDNLVLSLDSKSVVMREILVPFLQDDQIRRVLKYEAEAHLHNYAIEDVVVDYIKVGEVKSQSKVLIFAAPKESLRETLDLVRAQGSDPMHVHLDIAALFNAAEAAGAIAAHPDCVILDIGASTTLLIVVKGGKLRSCRSLRTGSESITRVISQDLAVDTDSARDRARQGDGTGRPDDLLSPLPLEEDDGEEEPAEAMTVDELETAIVVQRQDDFLQRIYRETTRSIARFPTDGDFSAIYLTGAASQSGGIERRLEERFGRPVVRLDFLGNGKHGIPAADQGSANAGMGIALGCALKLLGGGGIDLEFRRDDMRYTRKFDLIKVALASAVSLVFILLFLIWLNAQNTLRVRRIEHSQILNLVNARYVGKTVADYKKILDKEAKPVRETPADVFARLPSWVKEVDKIHTHITSGLGFELKGIPDIRSALSIWLELFSSLEGIRKELGYFHLSNVKINQATISFSGLIGDRADVDRIVIEVKKLREEIIDSAGGKKKVEFVDRVERERTEKDPKSGQFKFGMTIYLKQR